MRQAKQKKLACVRVCPDCHTTMAVLRPSHAKPKTVWADCINRACLHGVCMLVPKDEQR